MPHTDPTGLTGLRGRLHAPGPVLNAVLSLPEPGLATILGHSGYDFVVVDAEHGPFTLDTLRNCVEALASTPAATVVRLAGSSDVEIKQALDLGVHGIQVPNVASARQTAEIVRAARYPPAGARGIGGGRASRYGMRLPEQLQTANGSVAVLVMIESRAGVRAAAEIAAVDGLDGIVVGLMDLSADLGVTGRLDDPSVSGALDEVVAAAVAQRIKVGTGCRPEDVPSLAAAGMTLFTCFVDAMGLAAAAQAAVLIARGGGDGDA